MNNLNSYPNGENKNYFERKDDDESYDNQKKKNDINILRNKTVANSSKDGEDETCEYCGIRVNEYRNSPKTVKSHKDTNINENNDSLYSRKVFKKENISVTNYYNDSEFNSDEKDNRQKNGMKLNPESSTKNVDFRTKFSEENVFHTTVDNRSNEYVNKDNDHIYAESTNINSYKRSNDENSSNKNNIKANINDKNYNNTNTNTMKTSYNKPNDRNNNNHNASNNSDNNNNHNNNNDNNNNDDVYDDNDDDDNDDDDNDDDSDSDVGDESDEDGEDGEDEMENKEIDDQYRDNSNNIINNKNNKSSCDIKHLVSTSTSPFPPSVTGGDPISRSTNTHTPLHHSQNNEKIPKSVNQKSENTKSKHFPDTNSDDSNSKFEEDSIEIVESNSSKKRTSSRLSVFTDFSNKLKDEEILEKLVTPAEFFAYMKFKKERDKYEKDEKKMKENLELIEREKKRMEAREKEERKCQEEMDRIQNEKMISIENEQVKLYMTKKTEEKENEKINLYTFQNTTLNDNIEEGEDKSITQIKSKDKLSPTKTKTKTNINIKLSTDSDIRILSNIEKVNTVYDNVLNLSLNTSEVSNNYDENNLNDVANVSISNDSMKDFKQLFQKNRIKKNSGSSTTLMYRNEIINQRKPSPIELIIGDFGDSDSSANTVFTETFKNTEINENSYISKSVNSSVIQNSDKNLRNLLEKNTVLTEIKKEKEVEAEQLVVRNALGIASLQNSPTSEISDGDCGGKYTRESFFTNSQINLNNIGIVEDDRGMKKLIEGVNKREEYKEEVRTERDEESDEEEQGLGISREVKSSKHNSFLNPYAYLRKSNAEKQSSGRRRTATYSGESSTERVRRTWDERGTGGGTGEGRGTGAGAVQDGTGDTVACPTTQPPPLPILLSHSLSLPKSVSSPSVCVPMSPCVRSPVRVRTSIPSSVTSSPPPPPPLPSSFSPFTHSASHLAHSGNVTPSYLHRSSTIPTLPSASQSSSSSHNRKPHSPSPLAHISPTRSSHSESFFYDFVSPSPPPITHTHTDTATPPLLEISDSVFSPVFSPVFEDLLNVRTLSSMIDDKDVKRNFIIKMESLGHSGNYLNF